MIGIMKEVKALFKREATPSTWRRIHCEICGEQERRIERVRCEAHAERENARDGLMREGEYQMDTINARDAATLKVPRFQIEEDAFLRVYWLVYEGRRAKSFESMDEAEEAKATIIEAEIDVINRVIEQKQFQKAKAERDRLEAETITKRFEAAIGILEASAMVDYADILEAISFLERARVNGAIATWEISKIPNTRHSAHPFGAGFGIATYDAGGACAFEKAGTGRSMMLAAEAAVQRQRIGATGKRRD